MYKPFSVQTCKHILVASLSVLLVTSIFVVLSLLATEPVFASPNSVVYTDLFYSQPTAQTINPTSPAWVANATRARDKDNSTFAQFNYGLQATTNSYFEVKTFRTQTVKATPYPVIQQVDLKMRYEAEANTQGETYKIDYYVSPSTALQPLQTAAGAAFGPDTQVWSARSEPNDGVWNWTDIGNIKIRVTLSGTQGSTMSSLFKEYEAWATVVIVSSPRLFVNPANITDASKGIGSTFTVDVKLENISSSAGTEFKLRYDPEILNVTSTVPTPPASPAEDQALPAGFIYSTGTIWAYSVDRIHGIVYISCTAGPLASVPPPTFGSGKVAQLDFKVLGRGLTTLKLYDSVQGKPAGAAIPCDLANGYFRNVAMPYGAALEIIAPSALVTAPFTAQINISKPPGHSGAFGIYSWQFNLTYDKTVINATAVWQGAFLPTVGATTFRQIVGVNKGWVWANSTLNGDAPGAWGNSTIATVDFEVLAGGTPSFSFIPSEVKLTRVDYGAGPPSPKYDFPVYVGGVPVASFTYSPSEPKVGQPVSFDASTSFDLDGNIVDYSWDFGDGSTYSSTSWQATHIYSTDGTRIVNLTVTDNVGNYSSQTQTVIIKPLIHDIAVTDVTVDRALAKTGENVTINVSVKNLGDVEETCNVNVYFNGTLAAPTQAGVTLAKGLTRSLTFIWNTTGVVKGRYEIKANATGAPAETDVSNNQKIAIQLVWVGRPPVALFTYSPSEPKVNEAVTFDATNSEGPDGGIIRYSWDFGDTSADLGQVVTHNYTSVGIYQVNLTVTDENTLVGSKVISVTIKRAQSQVSISLSASSVNLGSAVTISGSITPKRVSASVTIQYKVGSGTWTNITSLITGTDGGYNYNWTPTTAGDYELRATWRGDANTEPDTSVTRTLRVETPQVFDIPWYALVGTAIALVAVVGLVVYFKKFRKR